MADFHQRLRGLQVEGMGGGYGHNKDMDYIREGNGENYLERESKRSSDISYFGSYDKEEVFDIAMKGQAAPRGGKTLSELYDRDEIDAVFNHSMRGGGVMNQIM